MSVDEKSSFKKSVEKIVNFSISSESPVNNLSKENDTQDRIGGTISSCIHAYLQGVQILRVHDVKEINQAFKVFRKLQN